MSIVGRFAVVVMTAVSAIGVSVGAFAQETADEFGSPLQEQTEEPDFEPAPQEPESLFYLSLLRTEDSLALPHFLMFGGFDLWRRGGFAHGGLLWSPDGLGREGFTFKLLLGGGRYQYQSGSTEITAWPTLFSALPGWRFKGEHFETTVFAGLDVQSHQLVPDDPSNRARGTHMGLRIGSDLWYQPTNYFMVHAGVSASTIGWNYWSRGAIGWRVFDLAWVGPEALALGDQKYHQYRAGIHVTAFNTDAFEWSAGFGYVYDSDRRSGAYGRIGLLTRR